ncbi:M6 family metalloprotease domain-containing protein, partial [bacterium]|nr:M6 family metalloprotease domain-containing protein [bacterium]
MKRLRIFLGIVFLLSAAAWAMPPHPDLAMKVRAFDVTIPYAMANRAELLARGVDAPQAFDLSGKFGASGRLDDTEMRVLILLATFSDHHYQTSATYFDSLIFGNQMGDMRHFYHEISYGEFHVTAGQTPSEIGWTDMPQTYAYYVDGANGFGNYPQNAQGLVVDLVNLVDPYVDFSVYDNNGDQYVDGLMVIHTGPGAEYTGSDNDIWSHAWSVPSQYAPYVDEVWVRNYSMEPEYWRTSGDMTCGVFAHEFGHQLGLPDLYDTDYSSEGVGDFSLMAGGSWNGTLGSRPAHMDAWCKTQVGFATATVLSENTTGIEIPCSEFSPVIYRVWRGGVGTGNEYFLIENRSSYGYSIGMHGITGLFIWHIDNSVSSNRREWYPGHTSSGHFLVALEQADGEWDLERNFNSGDGSDPYPGYSDNRTFSNSSLPNSMDYSFTPTDVLITNISDVDSTMTFDLSFAPQPYVLVQNPNGGEIWPIGTSVTIEIERYVTSNPAVISLSRNGGETWTQLFTLTGADTTWTVTGPTTTLALLKAEIFGADTLTDVSDNTFIIGETVLTLLHPNGGESISQNTPYQVTWDSYGYSGLISLFLNRS